MKAFEVIDISGDAGIRAFGETIENLFANAAMGMYSLITDIEGVKGIKKIDVGLESHSIEGLLVSWLNELIFHFDAYGFIGKKIAISEIIPTLALPPQGGGDKLDALSSQGGVENLNALPPGGGGIGGGEAHKLKATVSGEDFDPERHEGKLLIKAATYHQMKIEKENGLWTTNIIFDI